MLSVSEFVERLHVLYKIQNVLSPSTMDSSIINQNTSICALLNFANGPLSLIKLVNNSIVLY